MTTISIRIASRLRAVSTRVSPLATLEPVAETFTVSADNLFSANSNEILVRVEFSKKRFTIVEPRRASEVGELVERCSNRPPGVQHVVNDDDVFSFEIPRQMGRTDNRPRTDSLQIVAVKSDVERAFGYRDSLFVADEIYEAVRQLY